MGKTDPRNPSPYKQQSVIIVPAGHPGVTVERALNGFTPSAGGEINEVGDVASGDA